MIGWREGWEEIRVERSFSSWGWERVAGDGERRVSLGLMSRDFERKVESEREGRGLPRDLLRVVEGFEEVVRDKLMSLLSGVVVVDAGLGVA